MGKKVSAEESRRAGFIMGIVCPVRAAVKVHRACQPSEKEKEAGENRSAAGGGGFAFTILPVLNILVRACD